MPSFNEVIQGIIRRLNAHASRHQDTGADELALDASQISGDFTGIELNVKSKSSAYTATTTDVVLLCDASGGAFTITLPAAADNTNRVYIIKKIDSSVNAVTVDGNASETIDGGTTAVITTQYESIIIFCDGSNWHIT